jgi:pilus assembly protein CpaE
MVVFLVSECSHTANRLRQLLSQAGHDCPVHHVASYSHGADNAATARPKPDLIILVLSPDTERVQETLRQFRATGAHVLAIGPRDSNLILGAVRAGAQDYLEEDDLPRGLSAALSRMSESVQEHFPLGHLTTVLSASGGCGKTLVATNIAVTLAKAHGQCGLFDFDLVGSDVATFLGLKPRYTVADLCRGIDKLDRKMWEQSLLIHESCLSVLAGPESWDEARQINAEDLQKLLRFGRTAFSQVVVDLGPWFLSDRAPLLLESTTVLLLFRLDFAAVRNATRAVQFLNKIGVPSSNVQLAVIRYVKNSDISPSQAEAALGMKVRHFVPEDPPVRQRGCELRRVGRYGGAAVFFRESDRVARSGVAPLGAAIRRGRAGARRSRSGRPDGDASNLPQDERSRMHANPVVKLSGRLVEST